jgi:hypothetical protein
MLQPAITLSYRGLQSGLPRPRQRSRPARRNQQSAQRFVQLTANPLSRPKSRRTCRPGSRQPPGGLQSDLDHFLPWGGSLLAPDGQLATYLVAHAETLSVATLVRCLAAISVAHEAQGLRNPVRSPLIRATMRGTLGERDNAQRQTKPLLRDDQFAVLAAAGDGPKDFRDRGLLLLGFTGGFRRSETIAVNCKNLACPAADDRHVTPLRDGPGGRRAENRLPAWPDEVVPLRRL